MAPHVRRRRSGHRGRGVALLLACAVLAAACSSGGDSQRINEILQGTDGGQATDVGTDGGVPDPSVPPADQGAWTVLVYGMGDNDLEPFLLGDLEEMAGVGSTEDVNIVALVDRSGDYSADPVLNLPDFQDTRLLHVQAGQLVDISAGPAEVNTGSPQTLADFIATGAAAFPAERYAVVLWDHGGGWSGMGADESDGFDGLDLAEIEQGLSAGMAAAGIDRLDMIGFDACLMATYEVASRMADYADVMVASAELEPGHGWNWAGLAALVENPAATAQELGSRIVATYQQQAQEQATDTEITLSVLDLTAMDALEQALGSFTSGVSTALASVAPSIGSARVDALSYGFSPDPSQNSNLVDFGMLLDGMAANGVDTSAVAAALDAVVVEAIDGIATAGSTGMSIYFPQFPEEFGQGYLFLEQIPHWPDFLTAYYEAGQAIPEAEQPTFINDGGQAEYFFDQDGLNIYGTFDLAAQSNIVETTIYYGILDENDGSIIYLGEEPGEASTDGSGLAAAIFDLTVLTLTDGVDTAYAYLTLHIDETTGNALIDIPLEYEAPGATGHDEVILSVVVDPADGAVLSETFYVYDPNTGAYGEATLAPDGLLFPIVLNIYPDGTREWIRTIDVGLWADLPNLLYDLEPLPSGTGLQAELAVYDYAGNVATVSMFDFVP